MSVARGSGVGVFVRVGWWVAVAVAVREGALVGGQGVADASRATGVGFAGGCPLKARTATMLRIPSPARVIRATAQTGSFKRREMAGLAAGGSGVEGGIGRVRMGTSPGGAAG
ncbi:MAG TPA: hypothetical protein PKG95_14190, partial [Anaerolineaceae bacterium]|nr:hypothetical protein [Anaerolineaceae bacterium]